MNTTSLPALMAILFVILILVSIQVNNLMREGNGKQKLAREERANNKKTLGLADISSSFAELKNTEVQSLQSIQKTVLKLDQKNSFKEGIKKYHQYVFSAEPGRILCRIKSGEGEFQLQIVTEDVDMELNDE